MATLLFILNRSLIWHQQNGDDGEAEEEDADEELEEDDDRKDEDYSPVKKRRPMPTGPTAPKETAKESAEEKHIFDAQFSVNVIDLFDPPKDIHFGAWNTRPVVTSEWKKLKMSMTAQGIKPFSPENMMPLIINPQHVDQSCIGKSLSGYKANKLVLSAEGEQVLDKLEMAGGRHRKAAIESIKEDKEKELLKVTKERTKASKKKPKKADAIAAKAEELKGYDAKIEALEEEISKIGRWGVILFDAGK